MESKCECVCFSIINIFPQSLHLFLSLLQFQVADSREERTKLPSYLSLEDKFLSLRKGFMIEE